MPNDRRLTRGARWDGTDLVLAVRVVPRASADMVVPERECLKVRLTSPPVEGRANQHLCRVLAKVFRVPKSHVVVDRGATSRVKRVRIIAPRELPEFLWG